MKKTKFFIFACLFVVLVLIGGLTYAWIGDNGMTSPIGITAHLHKSYFESGDGSAEYVLDGNGNIVQSDTGPFEIKYPIQFYYLTWLQKLGYFNADEDNDGVIDKQYHFYLSADLDMSEDNFVLPPIGTHDNPFIGTFDGQGHIISNLTIENNNTNMTDPPEGGDLSNVEIIGLFGVVGSLPNTSYTFDSSKNEIKDLYINNVNIKTSNTNVLIGIAAGYVNASVSGVGVINSSIEFTKTHTALSYTSNLSDYSLIGYCTDDYKDSAHAERIELSEIVTQTIGNIGQQSGNSWGGSIDMKSLNVRLYNHLNDLTHTSYSTNGYYGEYESTYSKISVVRGDKAKTYYTRNPLTTQTFYNLMGNGNHTYKESYTLPGTYIPLLENADGTVPTKNTGYIVSDSQAMNNVNGTVRSASYLMRYIANSLVGTKATDVQVHSGTGSAASVSFNSSNLEVLTNKGTTYSTSNYYLIKDNYNKNHSVTNAAISGFTKSDATTPESLGLEKYTASREALDSVLSGESYIHGIHFMGTAISTSKTITIPTAIINGATKTSYVVPKSCIDFNLKEDGIINFFGGSYYARTESTGSYADSFFSLNYITRNAQDGITSIKQINNIYLNTNTAEGQPKYVYQFSDNTYSTGTRGDLVFNMNFIMNEPPARNALYYFEIPVNAGEYALGTVSGKSGGGYLMYLDISANSQVVERTVVTETWQEEVTTGEFPEGVAFVNAKGDTVDAIDSATFSLGTSASGKTTYSRTNDDITYTDTNDAQVGYVGDGITINGNTTSSSRTTILTERRTFYDVNQSSGVETITVTTTIITTNPDGTTTRTATQTIDGVANNNYNDDNHAIAMGNSIAVFYFTDTSGASVTKSYDFNYKTAPSTYNVVISSDKTIKVHAQLLNNGYTVKLNNTNITATDTEYTVSGS